ncbi:MAG: tRNA 2-thiocytidine biosynthesis protein TtcA [Oscillospiraceae bacterium]|nr:tRNA 2-thiocytidine biosynthesis protein TtcA [Oscillospiraceae bacterium]
MKLERYKEIERSIIKTYRKSIWKRFIAGINKYKMINEGDKIAVCISGGKDSMLLAKCVQEIQRHGVVKFDAEYLVMDPGYNPENRKRIIDNAKLLNIPIHIFETQIFDSVVNVGDHPCYLCARMRRGYLYKEAQKLGCNKIALGHHFDDVIETILMGMLYGAQIQTMMPKLHSTNHPGMELIRPLYMVKEKDIIAWARRNELQFIQCACRFTENIADSEDGVGHSKRQEMKELIKKFRQTSPYIDKNIFNSVQNVNLTTIIGYHDNEREYNFLDDYDERGKKC